MKKIDNNYRVKVRLEKKTTMLTFSPSELKKALEREGNDKFNIETKTTKSPKK